MSDIERSPVRDGTLVVVGSGIEVTLPNGVLMSVGEATVAVALCTGFATAYSGTEKKISDNSLRCLSDRRFSDLRYYSNS